MKRRGFGHSRFCDQDRPWQQSIICCALGIYPGLHGIRLLTAQSTSAGGPAQVSTTVDILYSRASINADASQEGAAAEHACDESDRRYSGPAPDRSERSRIAA